MKKILIVLLIISYNWIYSQSSPHLIQKAVNTEVEFPAQDNYKVSPTGATNVNIPFFNIKEDALTTSISMSNTTKGFKPDNIYSTLGQGWSFNIPAKISVEVRGLPDFIFMDDIYKNYIDVSKIFSWGLSVYNINNFGDFIGSILSTTAMNGRPLTPPPPVKMEGYCGAFTRFQNENFEPFWFFDGTSDKQQDIYHYKIPGYSGSFYLLPKIGAEGYVVHKVIDDDVIIEMDELFHFRIKSPNGIIYHIGKYLKEGGTFQYREAVSANLIDITREKVNKNDPRKDYIPTISEFKVVCITNPVNNNEIYFDYDEIAIKRKLTRNTIFLVDPNGNNTFGRSLRSPGYNTGEYRMNKYWSRHEYSVNFIFDKCLTKVHSNGGTINLEYENFELNPTLIEILKNYKFDIENLNEEDLYVDKKIKTIDYKNQEKCIRKKINYSKSKGDFRWFIDGIDIYDCNDNLLRKEYLFDYYNRDYLPNHGSINVDSWGFYNGSDNYQTLGIPSFYRKNDTKDTYQSLYYKYNTVLPANRKPNASYSRKTMLKSVVNPSGGKITFDYVGHKRNDYDEKTVFIADFDVLDNDSVSQSVILEKNREYTFIAVSSPSELSEENSNDNGVAIFEIIPLDNPQESTYSFNMGRYGDHTFKPNLSGKYLLKVTTQGNVNANFKCFYKEKVLQEIGGLKVNKIITSDPLSGVSVRKFDYTIDDNPSSTEYSKPIHRAKVIDNSEFTVISSEPLIPLFNCDGNHISYKRITETIDGGKIIIKDYSGLKTRVLNNNQSDYFYTPDESFGQNNLLQKITIKDSNDNIILSENYRYSNSSYKILSDYVNWFGREYQWYDRRNLHVEKGMKYNITPKVLISKESVIDGVYTTTSYKYDDPKTIQPTEVTVTEPTGKQHITRHKYPHSFSDNVSKKLVEQNRISPLFTEKYVKVGSTETKIDGTETKFSFFGNNNANAAPTTSTTAAGPYPHKIYRDEITWNGGTRVENKVLQATYNTYNTNVGKPSKITVAGWQPYTYTWNNLGNLTKSKYLNHEQEYQYYPYTRLLQKITAIDGTSITYTYDDFLRLKTTLDDQRGVKTTYDYAYGDPTQGGNYIKTTTTFPAVSGSNLRTLENIQYYDGLGRPIVSVAKKQGSTSTKDVYTTINYDNRGRVYKTFEPFELTTGTGFINPYSTTYSVKPHTLNTYDDLDRVLSVNPPTLGTTTYTYGSNTAGEVSGYGANQLFSTKVTDPLNGKSIVYTDVLEKEILSRRLGEEGQLNTYKKYDLKERLSEIAPPGSTLGNNALNYFYTYTGDDQVKTKKIPDQEGIMEYWYDVRNLVTHTQDVNLRKKSKYIATTYDAYGRPLFTGFTTSTNPLTGLSTTNPFGNNVLLSFTTYGTSGIEKGKPVNSGIRHILPDGTLGKGSTSSIQYDSYGRAYQSTSNTEIQGKTYTTRTTTNYDRADNILKNTMTITHNGTTKTITERNTIDYAGRASDAYHKYDNNSEVRLAHVDFTARGQVKNLKLGGSNPLVSLSHSYLSNGFLDKVTAPNLYHLDLDYFTDGNISKMTNRSNDGINKIYTYQYDKYDRLKSAMSNDGAYNTNYTYDKRGNIKTLNRNGLYNYAENLTTGQIDKLSYTYTGNRLKRIADTAPTLPGGEGLPITGSDKDYTYDDNGNMTYMPHRQATMSYNHLNLPTTATLPDGAIKYTYSADGTLSRKEIVKNDQTIEIKDYIGGVEYVGGKILQINHSYGRLTLNKNCRQTSDIGGIIDVNKNYEGSAIDVNAIVNPNKNVNITASKSITLKPGFSTKNTFLAKIGNGCTENGWIYEYAIKDHLGNTRLMVADDNNDGTITDSEIKSEYHYYPFGMEQKGKWQNRTRRDNKYRYNGKELHNELGLNFYNYGARYYATDIGRFTTVDPLAEKFAGRSPYEYVFSNPVRLIDPTGMGPEDWVRRDDGSIYWDDNAISPETTKDGETYLGKGGFSIISDTGLQTNYNSDKTFDHHFYENTLPEVTITASEPSRLSTVNKMYWEWDIGTGPQHRTFNNNSVSFSFQDAHRVNQAREFWYNKARNSDNYLNTTVTNYKGSFGLADLFWRAGTDPVEQFVGSYSIQSIVPDGNNNLTFTLWNSTSVKSLLYGIGPDWERSSFRLNGNTEQTYIFTEPINFSKLSK